MALPYNGQARDPVIMLPLFRAQFPVFGSDSDAEVLNYLGLATNLFGGCELATLWLTAHLMCEEAMFLTTTDDAVIALDESGNAALSSGKVDGISAGFQNLADDKHPLDNTFTQTVYGRNFLRLRNICPRYRMAIGIAGGNAPYNTFSLFG